MINQLRVICGWEALFNAMKRSKIFGFRKCACVCGVGGRANRKLSGCSRLTADDFLTSLSHDEKTTLLNSSCIKAEIYL